MVMATVSLCHPYDTGDMVQEVAGGGELEALHERLVAYVHALAPPHVRMAPRAPAAGARRTALCRLLQEARSGVWVEHSYARARGAAHAPAPHVRVLLAPRAPPAGPLDVERDDAPPSPLAALEPAEPAEPADPDAGPDADDEQWEARIASLAPSAAHASLAERALDALRRLRLARLAAPRAAARHHERAAARRLRHALAGAAAAPGPAAQRPAPWLHATLLAYLPRAERRLYDSVLAELNRAAPRLAARLAGGRAPPPPSSPLERTGPARGADAPGPWLAWVCGSPRQDARWVRRLGALLHTRRLAGAAGAAGAAGPEAWVAALAGAARTALADLLAEAGERPVILCGAGAGASLCAALAAGGAAGVRGVLLLAPALPTAEGAADALAALRLPLLLVAGAGAPGPPGPAPPASRRLLEVRGADSALRLPAAARARLRLPQAALDAAIADECARWALEAADAAPRAATPPPARRRAPPAPLAPPADHEEYAHLPTAATRMELECESPPPAPPPARVVSRGSGATPLALLPPARRPAPPPPPPALAPADILRLPIVFADDEPAAPLAAPLAAPGDGPVTVTSGRAYTRVIVASRARPSRPSRPSPRPSPRPLLLRRAVRLVARSEPR